MEIFSRRVTEEWVYPILDKSCDTLVSHKKFFTFLSEGGNTKNKPLHLYFHIPFCTSFCLFCPYYKERLHNYSSDVQMQIFKKYEREMYFYSQKPYFKNLKVNAIQFGGGSPSCISPEIINYLINKAKDYFDLTDCSVISMEANIKDLLDLERLKLYCEYGVNRISFGVQTLNEKIRKQMGISSTKKDVVKALENIERCNYLDYSFDLIYNLPNQTMNDIERDVLWASQTNASYIDVYNLNIFPNTLLKQRIDQGDYYKINPSFENEIHMVTHIYKSFKKMGFFQVAANTFSKKFNKMPLTLSNCLSTNNYLGIGPTARSFISNRIIKNALTLEEYISKIDINGCSAYLGHECNEEELYERELVFFSNKLKISYNDIKASARYSDVFDFLLKNNFIEKTDVGFKITLEGSIWAGNISQLFFSNAQHKKRSQLLLNSLRNNENPYNQDKMGVVTRI